MSYIADLDRQKGEEMRGRDEITCHNCPTAQENKSDNQVNMELGFVWAFLIILTIIGGVILLEYLVQEV